ncbi:MAG: hypothetical protein JWM55_577 [Acidimicrobiaceae bacterium]|nr:hypothetical protein [Acidimicrobiaceae bacterium]
MTKRLLPALLLVSTLFFAACGSPATPPPSGTTTSSTRPGANSRPAVRNLLVTGAVRKNLLQADAAYHSYPASDYRGLAPGLTYYAFDAQNDRYYAAAGIVPNSKSMGAQVGTQDDGGYNLFTMKRGAPKWTIYDDGLGGAEDSICPLSIPLAVRRVWNWTMHPCYPNS